MRIANVVVVLIPGISSRCFINVVVLMFQYPRVVVLVMFQYSCVVFIVVVISNKICIEKLKRRQSLYNF